MKVFIDTNILLDIYHLSGPDLEELRKLRRMVEKNKVELLVSQQVLDEFWRNRERVIADAMKNFRDSRAAAKIPNIIRAYPESKDLKEAVDKVNAIVRQLGEKANADIEADSLKADEVVRELFSVIEVGEITSEIIQRARLRSDIGNPPGKRDSIGDAINWEWLMEQDVDFWEKELVLISADGDYESELTKGRPKEFLLREWNTRNPDCRLVLDKSLPEFFQREFPDILLAEEIDKLEAVERLERSGSFAATHSAIAMLLQYDDFKDSELQRILTAYLSNNQIQWILGDDDVRSFAAKIVDLSKGLKTSEMAASLKELLDQLDEEIPF